MFEIAQALFAHADDVVADKRTQGEAERGVEISRRRGEAGKQAEQIAQQNEEEKCAEEGDILPSRLADNLIALGHNQLNKKLGDVARTQFAGRNHRILRLDQRAARGDGKKNQ